MLEVHHIIRLAAPLGCILAFSVQKTKEKKNQHSSLWLHLKQKHITQVQLCSVWTCLLTLMPTSCWSCQTEQLTSLEPLNKICISSSDKTWSGRYSLSSSLTLLIWPSHVLPSWSALTRPRRCRRLDEPACMCVLVVTCETQWRGGMLVFVFSSSLFRLA